jgi:hypothetical protein
MAKGNLSKEELAEIRNELQNQAAIQKKISESAGDYLKIIKDIKNLHKDISTAERALAEQTDKVKKAEDNINALKKKGLSISKKDLDTAKKTLETEEQKAKILIKEIDDMRKYTVELTKAAKEAGKLQKSLAVFKDVKNDISTITTLVKTGYSKIKGWAGLFDMDKSIRMSALSMGVLSKQTDSFRNTLSAAANSTVDFGVGIEDLAKLQATYSEELGRSVTLTQTGLQAMGELAAASNLGADGSAKLAADMDNIGMSAERTRDFVEQTMNDAHKMGLNASKVIKNIAGNMKMLNKYNFKGGVKGLAKMAETASKLGVDMNFVAGMADKLFDIEGAVDMSAQLQVMGGEWAKLADPFKLMYMARNDMEGLMEAVGGAAAASAHFSKESKTFEISALEMHRLRKVAEQTGVSYEELAQAGKNAAKFTNIKKQVHFNVDKETQEFLTNTAQFNEKGEATLNINGSPKLLKDLDIKTLKAQIAEKASLKQRAEDSQTFDETLGNLVKQFKQLLLPLVTELYNNLRPVIKQFSDTLKDPTVLAAITDTAKTIGRVIGLIGKFVANNPITSLLAVGLFESAKWILNGIALGTGFNTVASAGGMGGMTGGLGTTAGQSIGSNMKGALGSNMLKLGGVIAGLTTAIGEFSKNSKKGMSTGENLGRSGAKGAGAGLGAWGGAALGASLGTAIFPGIGTAIGALIGGGLGVWGGGEIGEMGGNLAFGKQNEGPAMNDGVFGTPIHDGRLGSDFSKGRGLMQGGKIHPIDNKDDLMAMKPNGVVDKAISKSSTMKIEFGEIHFRFDELKVSSPGNPGQAVELTKDPQFIRNITRMIHVETEKAINGGKVKPT